MAFTQATAPHGQQTGDLLSADNALPERHILVATLRNAAPRLGLSASVLTTLDAMLSCLAPKRTHHTVFASNATLCFRLNGISDRTVRRHASALQDAGLLVRNDSPNRKRFTKHSRAEGTALRFGFDLTPLFNRLQEIATLAAEVIAEREQVDYVRAKIRAGANQRLQKNPDDQPAQTILKLLRRKLTLDDCNQLLAELNIITINAEATGDNPANDSQQVTGNNGQNVRHHHKSNKELIDRKPRTTEQTTQSESTQQTLSVPDLLTACPEAAEYSLRKIQTTQDVVDHARMIAPMIGIAPQSFEAAHRRLGGFKAALTVWAIMQFHEKIGSVGAYFHALTLGPKSVDFNPEQLVRRLGRKQRFAV